MNLSASPPLRYLLPFPRFPLPALGRVACDHRKETDQFHEFLDVFGRFRRYASLGFILVDEPAGFLYSPFEFLARLFILLRLPSSFRRST